jgi:hypothetical protein
MTYERIVAWISQNFNLGDLRLSRCLGKMVAALIKANEVSLAAIGRAIKSEATEASCIRRVFEFCHNPRVKVEVVQETLIRLLTGHLSLVRSGGQNLAVVAMDWHIYDAGGISGLRVSLMTGTRALPLFWYEVLTKDIKGLTSALEEEAIHRLIAWRPKNVTWLILLDAGFHSPRVLDALGEAGYFIIRSGSHVYVKGFRKPWSRVRDLPVQSGQLVEFGWIHWTQNSPRLVRLVAARIYDIKPKKKGRRKANKRGRSNYTHPGLCAVITNLPLDEFNSVSVIRLYGRRFEIEHSFRDIRNASFGMDMEHVHLREKETYSRLMCVVALAEALLWLAGSEAEALDLQRELTPSRPRDGRRVLSLRNLGRLCIDRINKSIDTLIDIMDEPVSHATVG